MEFLHAYWIILEICSKIPSIISLKSLLQCSSIFSHFHFFFVLISIHLCNIFYLGREAFSNTLQDTRVTEKNIKVDTPEVTELYVNEDMFTAHDSKPNNDNIDSPKQKENTGSCTLALSDSIYEPMAMIMNENSILKSKIKEKCQYIIDNAVQVDEDLERNNPSVKYNSNGSASTVKVCNLVTFLVFELIDFIKSCMFFL